MTALNTCAKLSLPMRANSVWRPWALGEPSGLNNFWR